MPEDTETLIPEAVADEEEDFSYLLEADFDEEEEKNTKPSYSPNSNDNLVIETNLLKNQVKTVTEQLALQKAEKEKQQRIAFFQKVLGSEDIPDGVRTAFIEVVESLAKDQKDGLSEVYSHLTNVNQQLELLTSKYEQTREYISNIYDEQTFNKAVRNALESAFTKNSIKQKSVDASIEAHVTRYKKDPAYKIRIDELLRSTASPKQKQKELAAYALDSFKKLSKAKQQGATAKKNVEEPKAKVEKTDEKAKKTEKPENLSEQLRAGFRRNIGLS